MTSIKLEHINTLNRVHPPSVRAEARRRATNVIVAAVAIVLTAPLMVLIALAIKLTSRGSILFAQTRIGIDRRRGSATKNNKRVKDVGGKPFTMYKFRTMVTEDGGPERWASADDPRITPIGGILRKYRVDELPQLFNVLMGDMNVVGPRPEQPTMFADLREQVAQYQVRQEVPPGITGWAQIHQHYDTCLDDVRRKVALDLEYLGRRSATEDLKIMLKTVPVMVFKKGGW